MKANANEIARALDGAAEGKTRFFLLYGADEAGSAALARRLERAMGTDAERIDLEASALKSDPALLSDEAASISLFGGKRWIRIQPAGDEVTEAVRSLLDADQAGNPVVAVAGALKPSSSLVKLATEHKAALAHPSYVPDARDAAQIADALAREAGLRLSRDVGRAIAAACGNDRAVMAQEVEKLALYLDAAPDRPAEADLDALAAIGAASNEGELGKLVDAVMGGQPARAGAEIARLGQDGLAGIPLLRALFRRVLLLAALRKDVEGGMSPSAAVEARGKAIFFKEKPAITDQAGRWSSDRLAQLADKLLAAERALKTAGSAGEVQAEVEMLTIARFAARRR
ncbi:MAG: DNA polymerase III subunit delta [Chakrabartia sp.]